jgi:signal transduction histidine kinase
MTLATEDGESPTHPDQHPEQKRVSIGISDEQAVRLRELAQRILHEPFTRRPWMELAFWMVSGALGAVSLAVLAATMFAGLWLIITFVGLIIIAFSLRMARGFGRWQRILDHNFLGESVEEPTAFVRRPGFFGWLQSALRDRVAWRSVAYFALKMPWTILGAYVAFSLWWDAFAGLVSLIFSHNGGGPPMWGLFQNIFLPNGFNNTGVTSFGHNVGLFVLGVIALFAAPWVMRGFVTVDKLLIRTLLGPDPVAARVRSLEQARTTTVDASAATLRRIERDLHDGTQAQLVALAMRLGMAKEKLDDTEHVDLDRVRELVDEAHRGAKEAITELRDIARGIHPPALDIGLEGALATLASRSAVPTELHFDLRARPTPAIEAIAYYCVAELLANVAQHAQASRATVSCAQQGTWLRLVVRDDGRGGAHLSTVGSTSSGLAGLTERVRTVDGRLDCVSPHGGPTVITVDLPLSA